MVVEAGVAALSSAVGASVLGVADCSVAGLVSVEAGALFELPPQDDIMAATAKTPITSTDFFIAFCVKNYYQKFAAKLQIISVNMCLYLLVLIFNFAK